MKKWRIHIVFLCFLLTAGYTLYEIGKLQIIQGDRYKAFSQGLHLSFDRSGNRGEMFLDSKNPLAINIKQDFVFINSGLIENLSQTMNSLSEIINIDRETIKEKVNQSPSYAIIKKGLSSQEVSQIKQLNIDGVFVNTEHKRYYPRERFLSPVLGFVGNDGHGHYGLEKHYEEDLKVKEGATETKRGSDLFLTINHYVQSKAESLLKKAQKNFQIKEGEIIVIDPNSGKIIAMAGLSGFNPNYYFQERDLSVFNNKSVQYLFEPGSVFKPITIASAIEEGKIGPETTYQDPGLIEIDDYIVRNYDRRVYEGETTMTEVLEKSINTGAVFAQQELGGDLFLEYLERFGFFEPTGIDVQETYSLNKEIQSKREVSLITGSFGQGIIITPIQLIRSYCALANGGKLITPYLVEKIIDADNNIIYPQDKNKEIEVISKDTSSKITSMLVSVVENGFGRAAQVPGYFIAGKTGTAQVSYGSLGINKSGYSDQTIQSFIGYAPAFNPRFLILVKLDNPSTKTAEYSAIPIFKELTEYILYLYQVPFDYDISN